MVGLGKPSGAVALGDPQGKDAAGLGAGGTAPCASECASMSCNPVSVDPSAS